MPKKADKELKEFKQVVDLLRRLYRDDYMKILVSPNSVELKIEEEAIEKYAKGVDLSLDEVKGVIQGEVSSFLNTTKGDYERSSIDLFLRPSDEKETKEAREKKRKILEEKLAILKETELEWSVRRRYKAKLRAKTSVIAEARWEICRKLADERKSKRDSAPFATIEFRYLIPPFRSTEIPSLLSLIFGAEQDQKALSLMCDKEDIRYLINELKKIEDELETGESK